MRENMLVIDDRSCRLFLRRVNPKKLVSIQRKVQAHLASDRELKEEAQRAFQSYLKSVFLMRDKLVFDVFKLDTDSFAASLGLAVPPRVRFLQKQLKMRQQQKGASVAPKKEEGKSPKRKPIMKVALDGNLVGIVISYISDSNTCTYYFLSQKGMRKRMTTTS